MTLCLHYKGCVRKWPPNSQDSNTFHTWPWPWGKVTIFRTSVCSLKRPIALIWGHPTNITMCSIGLKYYCPSWPWTKLKVTHIDIVGKTMSYLIIDQSQTAVLLVVFVLFQFLDFSTGYWRVNTAITTACSSLQNKHLILNRARIQLEYHIKFRK